MANNDWSDREVELIVADYFSMLSDELKGNKVNKTAHRDALAPLLNERSKGSIEFKHQNISAALVEMGLPFINGYKPLYNFQRDKLYLFIGGQLNSIKGFDSLLEIFSESTASPSTAPEYSTWVVPPPEIIKEKSKNERSYRPVKINYLEKEQNNRNLGFKGEELALSFERQLLLNAGKNTLAESIEWVSKDLGDGLGFDILSRNLNGTDKYIEVKTTKLSKETPFFFSSNEYSFSKAHSNNYHLYRIFNFSAQPLLYTLNGSFDAFCKMEPTHYKGFFK